MSAPLVVLGDALLDIDLLGRAGRLAPDAPAPVLDELRERARPGGAALAAALAARDGLEVVLLTGVCDDPEASRLAELVEQAGVRLVALPRSGRTEVKQRVRAGEQTLVRLDRGGPGEFAPVPSEALEVLQHAAAVLVSDYGRGAAAVPALRAALAALPRRVPVVWDPHPQGPAPLPGARLVTPNEAEASALAPSGVAATESDAQTVAQTPPGRDSGVPATESDAQTVAQTPLARASRNAAALVAHWQAAAVAVTLGERGAVLSHGESSPSLIPAPEVTAADVCGAGDRFASAAAVALLRGAVTLEAVQEAVVAAAAFVAEGGAAAYDATKASAPAATESATEVIARVRRAGGTVVATGGCFDLLHAGHVATLEAARSLGDCLVVCLNSDDSVRRLKGPERPLQPAADRARVLAALGPVDAVVVFDEDTPTETLRTLRPDVWVKGGDYAGAELPEAALLREWGGVSVVVPYLPGRSTTRLVESVRAR